MTVPEAQVPAHEFDWQNVARLIFTDKGIHEGLWRVGVGLAFSGATMQWEAAGVGLPTAVIGVQGLAVFPATEPGPMVFDAAEINPQKSD